MTTRLGVKGYVNLEKCSNWQFAVLGRVSMAKCDEKWAKFVGFLNRDFVHL